MKKTIIALQIFTILAFFTLAFCLGVLLTPSEQKCLQAAIQAENGTFLAAIADATGAGTYAYQVEDHIFYRKVTNRITGQVVAYAYLGSVHLKK